MEIHKGYLVVGKYDKAAAIGETLKVSSFGLTSQFSKSFKWFSQCHPKHFQ